MHHANDLYTIPKTTLLLACLVLFLPLEVSAIDAAGNWNVRGIGSGDGSCGQYVRDNVTSRQWFEHWMMGYISGVNRARRGKSDYSNRVAAQGLVQWIENYCTQNPLSSFSSAVDNLLDELDKKPRN